jgi:Arc/MetJ-type ribon-helix-helix transcriptional regulator
MKERVTIKIPRRLYEQLKELVENTGFSSVTDFIVYVMRDVVTGGKLKGKDELTDREVRMVRERLKRLGYLK